MKRRCVFSAALSCSLIAGCSPDYAASSGSDSSSAVVSAEETPQAASPASDPKPNYIRHVGAIYYYSTDGDPVGFVYRGRNGNGLNIILVADRFGRAQEFAGCEHPCRTIRSAFGEQMPYDENTLVGSVFQDIENGFLKPVFSHPYRPITTDPDGFAKKRAKFMAEPLEDQEKYRYSPGDDPHFKQGNSE